MAVRPFHDDEAPTVLDEIARIAAVDRAGLVRRTGIAAGISLVAASRGIPVPVGLVGTLARRETEERLETLAARVGSLKGDLRVWLEANGVTLPPGSGMEDVPRG